MHTTSKPNSPPRPREEADRPPRLLMLGMGWFPPSVGGLDRYYRALFEQLPEAHGVVVGPAERAPATVAVVADSEHALLRRLLRFYAATRRAAAHADLLDAHFALYAAAPLLLGAARRRPAVFHFHGPWAEESRVGHDGARARHALRKALERSALKRAQAHVVLSGAFRRVLVEQYRVSPWNVHVWPPGVALDLFTPGDRAQARKRLGLREDAFVAVCVRRLVPRMGIDGLLEAWSRTRQELPSAANLLLVGDGPLAEAYAERAREPELAGSVRLLGRVGDEELADAYRAADVAVVPTLSFEGFGLVVLEAAACGTPTIVTDVGGLPEAAGPLDPSLVVPGEDVGALGARMVAAARGELPSREQSRSYAERFSWRGLAERHRALYRDLLAGRRDERLRVVYLDHIARLSGGEIALLRLLPHLRGVNAHVILGEDGPLAQRLQHSGVSVEVLALSASSRDLRRDRVRPGGFSLGAVPSTLLYVLRLALRLRRLKPDLVHANSLKAGVYGSLAAKLAGVPMVWHVRDRIAEDYLPRPAVLAVRGLISRLAGGVLANSEATISTLSRRDRERGWVIPDSVEPSPRAPSVDPGVTTFGMLGRIAPWKGQDLFLRAFAAAFGGGSERAVIVGTPLFGEEPYELELRELVARLGLSERVEFRGFQEDIWRELARFDVLVHASVIPEPFGQVVIEGMAAGLAVIGPDQGGPAEVIADGETGRLFGAGEVDSLAQAMTELCADPGLRARLGANAKRAVERFRPQTLAGELERAYASVPIARRHGAASHRATQDERERAQASPHERR
jgi:glycosyltransferase involved in cell wall biosynthesis